MLVVIMPRFAVHVQYRNGMVHVKLCSSDELGLAAYGIDKVPAVIL